MLKTNTFRPDRYLRSKFLEGRYLLATELVDVELELLDQFRKSIKTSVGNVAVGSGWEVSYYSNTEVVIKPGSAWYEGLPFDLRSATDHMVVPGILPTGMTVSDIVYVPNTGIVIDFEGVATANYTIVISAEENIVTDIQDPFLKNANIPEATAQKIKLKYKINVVPTTNQGSFSTYKNESVDRNLTNYIEITNTSLGEGAYVSTNASSIPENIDGSNLEITFFNTQNVGPLPTVQADRASFINGILTDTTGQNYYITAMFTDPVNTNRVIVRVDKDIDQPTPTFTVGQKYKLTKRDVYVTDSSGSGSPIGRLYWPIAKVQWDNAGGLFQHSSKIEDVRGRIVTEVDYEAAINEKLSLQLNGGGVIDVETDGETLNWSAPFVVINPGGPAYNIAASSAVLLEGGTLAYNLDESALTPLSITVDSFSGNELTLSTIDLSTVKIGNVIKVGSASAEITSINNTSKILTVSPSISTTGSGYIYRHSFAEGTVKVTEKTYVIAVKSNGKIRVGNYLELNAGESNATYDVRIDPVASVIAAGTTFTLPNNPATGRPQYYDAPKRNLEVYVNQLLKYQGVDWISTGPQSIEFAYDLPAYTEIHFRIDSLPAGSLGGGSTGGGGGGGGGSLQDAYDTGHTIAVVAGFPVTFTGIGKLASFQGDIEVTGVIDPSGLQLTPQASNPLEVGQQGLWINSVGDLIHQKTTTAVNVTNTISEIQSGSFVTLLTKQYFNNTGAVIPAFTPVYSPSVGEIAIADGTDEEKYRVIGITMASSSSGATVTVALSGVIPSFTGYTHNKYLYLGLSAGGLTTTGPTLGPYPSGFQVVRLGIIEGSNLILQIQHVGTL